jgi:hypothetical protein
MMGTHIHSVVLACDRLWRCPEGQSPYSPSLSLRNAYGGDAALFALSHAPLRCLHFVPLG